jgi:hypothetical protein
MKENYFRVISFHLIPRWLCLGVIYSSYLENTKALYQIHSVDVQIPIEKTLSALNDILARVRYSILGVLTFGYGNWQKRCKFPKPMDGFLFLYCKPTIPWQVVSLNMSAFALWGGGGSGASLITIARWIFNR